jgi:uroporphyrinogen decarboxylase
MQIQAGADAVQIFDSWAGALSPHDFNIFALPYVKRIITGLETKVPVIYFPFNGSAMLSNAKECGADVIGIDWRIEIADAVKVFGDRCAVQGNLDPTALFGTPESIKEQAGRILKGASAAHGHIFNLGHGILPETRVSNAKALVDAVHELSNKR